MRRGGTWRRTCGPFAAPPDGVVDPARSVWIEFSEPPAQHGLRVLESSEGVYRYLTVEGVPAMTVDPTRSRFLYLQVAPWFTAADVVMTVEYLDSGTGAVGVRYDSCDETARLQETLPGAWKLAGNRIMMQDGSGVTYWAYDALDRSFRQEGGYDMSHRTLFYYDQASNVTCVRDDDMGLTYYTYDLEDQMTSVKNPFGEVTYYEYTPGGQVRKRTLGNDTLTYYEYDDVGRVSKVDNRKSDMTVISTFEYEHDKVGNPTKIVREDGSATYYSYDRIYQLTGETQVDNWGLTQYAFEYQYDKAHNRTVKVDNGTATYYAYNAANELTEETTNGQTTYYQYDRCGNTVAKQ